MEKRKGEFSTKNGYKISIYLDEVESVMDISSSYSSDSNTAITMKSGNTHYVMQSYDKVNAMVEENDELLKTMEYCNTDVEETDRTRELISILRNLGVFI